MALENKNMWTIALLTISNVFMTFAWYGHLKNLKSSPLWIAVLISWGIAFFEYCFQVPANRLGYAAGSGQFNLAQLKTIQEVITLAVFCLFSIFYMNQAIKWNHMIAFGLMIAAVFFVFNFKD